MDRIRTLLLARTHVVVMDPDLVASAATRPSRDTDAARVEGELARLGYVMSLDLATLVRRLPYQTVQQLHGWMFATLAKQAVERPQEQQCPWCSQTANVGALDPCGHLVCRECWQSGGFTGCPICHRRVALGEPFLQAPKHAGPLALLQLGLDVLGMARQRFERLLARTTPLAAGDRDEIEAVIDAIGPKAVTWLPARIPIKETLAIAIARLWLVGPNRTGMMRETTDHLRTATDVLRIAVVLMGGNADLTEAMRLHSIDRGLRRAVLDALEQLPLEGVVEDMLRHAARWKRVGERLHPFELARELPNCALAFAVLRGTKLASASFGTALREHAVRLPFVFVEDDRVKSIAWAGPIEDALRAGNPRSALVRLTHRPAELLRRADHLVRTAQLRQLDALQTVVKAVELAAVKGPPAAMLALASHIARRGRSWPRRVFFPRGNVLHAWGTPDLRAPLRGDAIAVIVGAIRRQLVARAELRRQFPRAVIDRALVDLMLPSRERPLSRSRLAWPRGSEIGLPLGQVLQLSADVAIELAVELFDGNWRHLATYAGKDHVELHLEKLHDLGGKHLVVAVATAGLPRTFGLLLTAADGVAQRFDVRSGPHVVVPLMIDLGERRLRWLDVQLRRHTRVALAHVGRDFADLGVVGARTTLWDLACIHATARANVIYVRERDGSFTMYRRRDNESKVSRLGRLMSGAADDGKLAAIPTAAAPTWFALETGIVLPPGSNGFALDARGLSADAERLTVGELIGELELP